VNAVCSLQELKDIFRRKYFFECRVVGAAVKILLYITFDHVTTSAHSSASASATTLSARALASPATAERAVWLTTQMLLLEHALLVSAHVDADVHAHPSEPVCALCECGATADKT
jgi:hypothetical protein